MTSIWDTKADAVQKGDKLRDVSPLHDKTKMDEKDIAKIQELSASKEKAETELSKREELMQ